jgi:hypothetical protein
METLEEIERRLQRSLTPRGFSDEGMRAIDEMLDELAGETEHRSLFNGRSLPWISGSAAAGLALAFGLTWMNSPESPKAVGGISTGIGEVSLVSEEQGVVAAEADERLLSDGDGNLMRAWHMQVVNRERFHDPQTGHEVTVVQPRDEMVLMPVSAF